MYINELAQWIVLAFLAVFVLGLTRQLGSFMQPGLQDDDAPGTGSALSTGFFPEPGRSTLVDLIATRSGRSEAAVFVLDEQCPDCQTVLDALTRTPRTDGYVRAAVVSGPSSDAFRRRVAGAMDLTVTDASGAKLEAGGIPGTPFALLVDDKLRVVAVESGRAASTVLARWVGAPAYDAESMVA